MRSKTISIGAGRFLGGLGGGSPLSSSLHSHRLSEITRLVDVSTPFFGAVVGKQLAGNGSGDGGKLVACLRNLYDIISDFRKTGVTSKGEADDGAVTGLRLHDIAKNLVVGKGIGAEDKGRAFFVEKGDRTMLHLASSIAAGIDIGDLFELKSPFKAGRIHVTTPDKVEVIARGILVCKLFDMRRERKHLLYLFWDLFEGKGAISDNGVSIAKF